MSENSHEYQVTESSESLSNEAVSNAMEEKFQEQESAKTLNGNHIEAESNQEPELIEQPPDEFSSKFAALSRKERDLRLKERDIDQKLAEYEAWKAEQNAQPEPEPEVPLDRRLRKDPLKTLEELGYTYEDLTKMVLNDGKMSTDMQMKLMREELERDYQEKFESLENKLAEKEKAEEEAKYEQTINKFKQDISNHINSSDKYDLIQANEAEDMVYDVIEQYYEENGTILDTSEAADQVEQYLEEEVQKVFNKSQKLKSRLTNANPPTASSPRQSPTLSNSQSVTSTQPRSEKLLSREESLARLASQIRWED